MDEINVNDLPLEVLAQIFRYTNAEDWIKSLSKVCSYWQSAMNLIWEKTRHFQLVNFVDEQQIYLTLNNDRCVSLSIGHDDSAYTDQSAYTDPLKKSPRSLEYLFANCGRYLTKIDFGLAKNSEICLKNIEICQNLRSLGLNGTILSRANTFVEVFRVLPNLEQIFLCVDDEYSEQQQQQSNVHEFTQLIDGAVSSCKNLRSFSLISSYWPPPEINVVDRLLSLTDLKRFCWKFTFPMSPTYIDDLLTVFTNRMTKITYLELGGCVTGSLTEIVFSRYLHKLADKLESLHFSFQLCEGVCHFHKMASTWSELTVSSLMQFGKLHELTLQSVDFSLPAVLSTLQAIAPQLTYLRLINNFKITESYFRSWKFEMPKLQTLALGYHSYCNILSARSITDFVLKCPQLQRLKLNRYCILKMELILSLLTNLHRCNRHINETNRIYKSSSLVVDILSDDFEKFVGLSKNHCGLSVHRNTIKIIRS